LGLNSEVCFKFERLINDEVAAALQFHDSIIEDGLKEMVITDKAKDFLGFPQELRVTLFELNKRSLDVLPKMRFIYLMSLFEAFVKEYICTRNSTSIDNYKSLVKPFDSEWDTQYSNNYGSKSALNLNYVLYLMDKLFNIKKKEVFSDITYEIGALRNLLVHYEGVIPNQYYLDQISTTMLLLKLPESINIKIEVSNEMMWIFIEDIRRLISNCDY
jgi:hypothetical protein